MSGQLNSNPASAAALLPQTVRILTPVFDYRIEGADRFSHSGPYKGAEFKMVLSPYAPADLEEIINHAHVNIRDSIRQGCRRLTAGAAGGHILLIEVALSGSAHALDMEVAGEVQLSTIEALRLHSTAGLPHDDQLVFSDSPHLAVMQWISRQTPFPHLPKPSVLRSADFAACQATGDILRSKAWGSKTFDKVVSLAKEYHRFSFTLEKVEHAFLILMVAYEAMFKKDHKEKASSPAKRIGRLLGATTQRDCKAIQKEFSDEPDSFSKIRNQIAHGDPNLNLATVRSKYPCLHRHLTSAIVMLLNLPSGSLNDTEDYYDEISVLTNRRFSSLPNS
jgi:hypothetical protein